ncbi:MAG: hypothetical protein ABIG44_11080 [Planctomycetota bacterium]
MLKVTCTACGARYKVPDSAAGRRAHCKKCGGEIAIPNLEPPDSGRLSLTVLDDLAEGESLAPPPILPPSVPPAGPPPPASDALDYAHDGVAIGPNAGYAAYFRALGRSLLFPLDPGNLVTFLILAFLIGMVEALSTVMMFSCIVVIAMLIVYCWFISFQLNVVIGAADGDEDLPTLAFTGGILDDMVVPLVKMLATYIVARMPALLFIVTVTKNAFTGGLDLSVAVRFLFGDYDLLLGLTQSNEQVIAWALYVGGLLMWPIFVLVVAGGSTGSLIRFDLMAITIIRSFPAYLVMVGIVYATQAIRVGAVLILQEIDLVDSMTGALGVLGIRASFTLLTVYATIVAMKAIGLHYHCFKHKYAWSWG